MITVPLFNAKDSGLSFLSSRQETATQELSMTSSTSSEFSK